MSNTIGEKVGSWLAFIPVLSTVAGAVKAINYYRRATASDAEAARALQLAGNVHNTALEVFHKQNAKYERKLFKVSLIEMVPLVNIIAGFIELKYLFYLHKVTEYNKFLFSYYGIWCSQGPDIDQFVEKAIEILDKLNITLASKKEIAGQALGHAKAISCKENPPEDLLLYVLNGKQGGEYKIAFDAVIQMKKDKATPQDRQELFNSVYKHFDYIKPECLADDLYILACTLTSPYHSNERLYKILEGGPRPKVSYLDKACGVQATKSTQALNFDGMKKNFTTLDLRELDDERKEILRGYLEASQNVTKKTVSVVAEEFHSQYFSEATPFPENMQYGEAPYQEEVYLLGLVAIRLD